MNHQAHRLSSEIRRHQREANWWRVTILLAGSTLFYFLGQFAR